MDFYIFYNANNRRFSMAKVKEKKATYTAGGKTYLFKDESISGGSDYHRKCYSYRAFWEFCREQLEDGIKKYYKKCPDGEATFDGHDMYHREMMEECITFLVKNGWTPDEVTEVAKNTADFTLERMTNQEEIA